MSHEKRKIYEALTRYNYFPNQKSNIGELPPCIDSRQFTPEVCEQLTELNESDYRNSNGYDAVEYNSTRYNNAPRILSLVHPKAHALLAKHIHDNWNNIRHITENQNSIIKPEHHHDGRIMVMNYGDPLIQTTRNHQRSYGCRFRVNADIANCFNSIYSHAIPWAIVGFSEAKQQRGRNLWFNQLDAFQRKGKRNETQGIPIGPATSSIAVELILGKIDEKLLAEKFDFHRYIDDYTCFCKTSEDAQKFILILGQALATFKLSLNLSKTKIIELPSSGEDDWVVELLGALPHRIYGAQENEPKITSSEALTFINRSIIINKSTPDGSVLKYAIQLIINYLDDLASAPVYESILNLAWHYPILTPYLEKLIDLAQLNTNHFEENLKIMIIENALLRRSDGMCWPLHILKKHNIIPTNDVIIAVIKSEDCVALTILHSMLDDTTPIITFSQGIISKDDNYEKDSNWLLLYQLFLNNEIENPYNGNRVFDVMKDNNVNFIPGNTVTDAERYSSAMDVQSVFSNIEVLQP